MKTETNVTPKEKQTKVEVDSCVTIAMRRGENLRNEGMVRPLRRESLVACRSIFLKKSDIGGEGRAGRRKHRQQVFKYKKRVR